MKEKIHQRDYIAMASQASNPDLEAKDQQVVNQFSASHFLPNTNGILNRRGDFEGKRFLPTCSTWNVMVHRLRPKNGHNTFRFK